MLFLKRDAVGEDDELADHFDIFGGFLVPVVKNAADSDIVAGSKIAGH